jgi:hypothetical protein
MARRMDAIISAGFDPYLPLLRQFCCDAQDGIATTI